MSSRKPNRRFVYRNRPRINTPLFGTFDIETEGLGGKFIAGATYYQGIVEHYSTIEDLFMALLSPDRGVTDKGYLSTKSVTWYAHNGAGYDFLFLAAELMDYNQKNGYITETVQQGQKPIQLTVPTPLGKVKLVDSYPLLDASLAEASKAYAPEYSKLGHCKVHDFTKRNAGSKDWYNPSCKDCIKYLELDVISLWHTYHNVRELIIKIFGVAPGLTAGSTAMKGWIYEIPKDHVYYRQSPDKEAFAKKFTTGAFTYPGNTTEALEPKDGAQYAAITVDRTAAFAACQLEGGYPVSLGIWTDTYSDEMFGFWECEAYCPPDVFPCVPLTNVGGKLWSTGKGIAYVTSEQYQFCIEQGYTLKVIRGMVFPRCEDVFNRFILKCQDLEYPPDGKPADPAVKALAKRMRNSLNGKFNIRSEMERFYLGEPVIRTKCTAKDPDKCTYNHVKLIEGAVPVIDKETGMPLPAYTIREPVDAPYAQPVWYAITVSRQQLEEHRLRLLMGDKTYKFDTDSATSTPEIINEMIDRGDIEIATQGYGTYKVEHYWLTLQSIGPKNYIGVELKNGEPKEVGYCKGLPRELIARNRDIQKRAANGEKVQLEFESTRTLIEMFKGHFDTPGIIRKRSLSTPNSAEGWQWDEPTKTFKPHHRE